eukprot:6466755-Amphidinium_carterae.1
MHLETATAFVKLAAYLAMFLENGTGTTIGVLLLQHCRHRLWRCGLEPLSPVSCRDGGLKLSVNWHNTAAPSFCASPTTMQTGTSKFVREQQQGFDYSCSLSQFCCNLLIDNSLRRHGC